MTDAAYREGFRARGQDDPASANPYPAGLPDALQWHAGWIDRDRHERDKGDALDSIGWNG